MLDGLYIRIIGFLCLSIGIVTGGLYYGHTRYTAGVTATRLLWDADRARWQSALDKQKHDALQLIVDAQAKVDALARNEQRIHAQQDKDYADHQKETDALRAQLATRSLRYAVASSTGRRTGSCGAVPSAAPAADAPARSVVQLPDAVAANLRQLTVDADNLTDSYRRCVQAVNGGPSL